MDSYKKERSSRQHMKIDLPANAVSNDSSQDGLLLANPMACDNVSPVGKQVTSPKHDSHFSRLNSTSPPALRDSHQSSTILHSRADSFELSTGSQIGNLYRASGFSSERSSFRDKSKSRPKSPSLFRFFVKQTSHSGSGSVNGSVTNSPITGSSGRRSIKRSVPVEDEEDYGGDASSNSDHEDPFSCVAVSQLESPLDTGASRSAYQRHPRGMSAVSDMIASRHTTESSKSSSCGSEQTGQQLKRHARNSSSGSGNYTCRDSGFSSERESVSQLREDREIYEDARCSVSPGPVEEFKGAGMEALESLHNQLQILIKQNSPSEDTESETVAVYEQVIASLSRQLEDLSMSLDCLRESDQTLRFSLKMAEQKVLESETKLSLSQERCQRMEIKYHKLYTKHHTTVKKLKEVEKIQQKQAHRFSLERAISSSGSPRSSSNRLPKRVQSQTQYDRRSRPDSAPSSGSRPSTAQGFHEDQPVHRKISSLSHTETCV